MADMNSPARRGALELLKKMRAGELRQDEVSAHERRVCVAYLRLEGYTQEEMAEVFGVNPRTIARDEHMNRKAAGRLVDDLDVRSVAGGLINLARHMQARAIKEKDYGLAWRIERELVADLQSLGYLPRAPEQHQVQLATFADLARLAAQTGEIEADATLQLPAGEENEDDEPAESPEQREELEDE